MIVLRQINPKDASRVMAGVGLILALLCSAAAITASLSGCIVKADPDAIGATVVDRYFGFWALLLLPPAHTLSFFLATLVSCHVFNRLARNSKGPTMEIDHPTRNDTQDCKETMIVSKIGVHSLSKYVAIATVVFGLCGLILVMGVFTVYEILTTDPLLRSYRAIEESLTLAFSALLLPFIYGPVAYVFCALTVWLFNRWNRRLGGIRIEVQSRRPDQPFQADRDPRERGLRPLNSSR
jgi:hypothetical protein